MDEDDSSAAEAHQMELEQREREEAAVARGRRVLAVFRWRNKRFQRETEAHQERMRNIK